MSSVMMAPDDEDIQVPVPELLEIVLDRGASDLHLTAGAPPTIRLHGDLIRLVDYPVLSPRALQGMIYAILPPKRRGRLGARLGLARTNALPARAGLGATWS